LLVKALLERSDKSRAQGELHAACAAFESLGARLDLARLAEVHAAVGDPA
jgi:hypothetical protein